MTPQAATSPVVTVPVCPKCRRPDCGLMESVIVGLGRWAVAIVECERERQALAKGGARATMNRRAWQAIKAAGLR